MTGSKPPPSIIPLLVLLGLVIIGLAGGLACLLLTGAGK